jgi:hypothetical protein
MGKSSIGAKKRKCEEIAHARELERERWDRHSAKRDHLGWRDPLPRGLQHLAPRTAKESQHPCLELAHADGSGHKPIGALEKGIDANRIVDPTKHDDGHAGQSPQTLQRLPGIPIGWLHVEDHQIGLSQPEPKEGICSVGNDTDTKPMTRKERGEQIAHPAIACHNQNDCIQTPSRQSPRVLSIISVFRGAGQAPIPGGVGAAAAF